MSSREGKGSAGRILLRVVVLSGLTAAAVFAWLGPRRISGEAVLIEPLPVRIVRPAVGDLQRTITVPAYIESESVVTLIPKVSGTLLTLEVDVGDSVAAGDTVGLIDSEPYRLAADQARASFEGSRSVYERTRQLAAAGAASEQALDQARIQYRNASAMNDRAILELGYTSITSPVDGIVVKRHTSRGAVVSPAVPVVTVSDNTRLSVRAAVPERYIRLFLEGREQVSGIVLVPALDGRSYEIEVRTVSPMIDARTKTFEVRADVAGASGGSPSSLLPGLYAAASFVVERREAAASLPFSALSGGDTLWYVDDEGAARRLSFVPGFTNDDRFEIPSEYRGYRFIAAGTHFMTAGTPVRIVGEEE